MMAKMSSLDSLRLLLPWRSTPEIPAAFRARPIVAVLTENCLASSEARGYRPSSFGVVYREMILSTSRLVSFDMITSYENIIHQSSILSNVKGETYEQEN